MSSTPTATHVVPGRPGAARPGASQVRRVRHQARETVALMAFSAAASVGVASVLLLLLSLGR